MAADLRDRRVIGFQVRDQIPQRLVLLRREVLEELVSRCRPVTTKQADADRAGVVPLRVGPDRLQWPSGYNCAVTVDQEMIPDVRPPAILKVPAPNLCHLLRRRACGPPVWPGRRTMDNDLVQWTHLIHR